MLQELGAAQEAQESWATPRAGARRPARARGVREMIRVPCLRRPPGRRRARRLGRRAGRVRRRREGQREHRGRRQGRTSSPSSPRGRACCSERAHPSRSRMQRAERNIPSSARANSRSTENEVRADKGARPMRKGVAGALEQLAWSRRPRAPQRPACACVACPWRRRRAKTRSSIPLDTRVATLQPVAALEGRARAEALQRRGPGRQAERSVWKGTTGQSGREGGREARARRRPTRGRVTGSPGTGRARGASRPFRPTPSRRCSARGRPRRRSRIASCTRSSCRTWARPRRPGRPGASSRGNARTFPSSPPCRADPLDACLLSDNFSLGQAAIRVGAAYSRRSRWRWAWRSPPRSRARSCVHAMAASDRVALLIGNNDYAHRAASQRRQRRQGSRRGAEGAGLQGDRARRTPRART